MKHDSKITIYLLLLFLTAQIIGLFILNNSIVVEQKVDEATGEITTVTNYTEIFTGRPDTEGSASLIYILSAIFVGTFIVLLLIKYRLYRFWKGWFFIAVGITLAISFDVFFREIIAICLGFFLAYLKVFRPNIYTHNITEIFLYSGIAVMLVPNFTVLWMTVLLVAISIYDAIAVWKSKHMISMAQFQARSKMFAGILIPYEKPPKAEKADIKIEIPVNIKEKKVRSAILGGGDIAFPLLFAGTVMAEMIGRGVVKNIAFFKTLVIPCTAGIALFLLLCMSKKDRFYPAMPFITMGCLVGYGILLLI
ncbi:hypothetical protein JW930_05710 [Candidatus Woesearchaeota archaeon]|nr:hypothetical protein [Candidatus Woesearchaeota archaeon]